MPACTKTLKQYNGNYKAFCITSKYNKVVYYQEPYIFPFLFFSNVLQVLIKSFFWGGAGGDWALDCNFLRPSDFPDIFSFPKSKVAQQHVRQLAYTIIHAPFQWWWKKILENITELENIHILHPHLFLKDGGYRVFKITWKRGMKNLILKWGKRVIIEGWMENKGGITIVWNVFTFLT